MLGPIVDRKLVISKFGLKEVDIATGKEVDATTFGKIKNFYWFVVASSAPAVASSVVVAVVESSLTGIPNHRDKKEMYFVIMTHNDRESNIPIVYRTSKGQGAELREEIDRFVKLAAVGDPARIPKFSADLKKFNKHLSADTEPGGEPISEDEEQQAEQEDEEQQAEQEEEEKTPSAPCAVPEGNLISFDF